MDRCRHMSISVILVILTLFVPCSIMAQAKGKLYVVGMGPAGPDLTAPRALKIVEKAEAGVRGAFRMMARWSDGCKIALLGSQDRKPYRRDRRLITFRSQQHFRQPLAVHACTFNHIPVGFRMY